MRTRSLLPVLLLLVTASASAQVVQTKSVASGGAGTSTFGMTAQTTIVGDVTVGSSADGSTLAWHGFLTPSSGIVTAVADRPGVTLDFIDRPSPNPTRAAMSIRFGVSDPRKKPRLEVYDLSGRRVAVLSPVAAESGSFLASWNLRDARGARVGAGIYFIRLGSSSFTRTERIVVIR
jgi:hypothetical protein